METSAPYPIRRAEVSDAEELARINIDVWHSTYAGIVDESILRAMELSQYIRKWRDIITKQESVERWCYVAIAGPDPVGYVAAGRNTDADGFEAVIHALYLRPEFHGQGIGIGLFEQVLGDLSAARLSSFKLYVLKANRLGRRFYDRYSPDVRCDGTLAMEGAIYCDMLYGWHHIPKIAVADGSR
jgi:ribosomal protein S18 acetylase RimI-like enzyme